MFVVRNDSDQTYSIPTVPVDTRYLSPISVPGEESALDFDARFSGKIKSYVKPIVFGGDPNVGDNLVWLSHEAHVRFVKFWNEKYRGLKSPTDRG
jgi:hypothetical protein